jgi:hypothetical protein
MEGRDAAKEASRGVFFSISFDRQSHLRRRLVAPIPKRALAGILPATNAPENGQHNCPISADLDRFNSAAQGAARHRKQIF